MGRCLTLQAVAPAVVVVGRMDFNGFRQSREPSTASRSYGSSPSRRHAEQSTQEGRTE